MRLAALIAAAVGLAACAPQADPVVGVRESLPANPTGSSGYQDISGPTAGVTAAAPGIGQQGDSQAYSASAPGRSNPVGSYVPRANSLHGSEGYQVPARPTRTGTASPSVQ